ncbi:hypothetical protein J6590_029598 [Homalodisca vitripennis]|nr:hypothetical protein J6590_029598 [Homalodisca vitripennis]
MAPTKKQTPGKDYAISRLNCDLQQTRVGGLSGEANDAAASDLNVKRKCGVAQKTLKSRGISDQYFHPS